MPLKAMDQFNIESEKPLQGIVKYSDGTVESKRSSWISTK